MSRKFLLTCVSLLVAISSWGFDTNSRFTAADIVKFFPDGTSYQGEESASLDGLTFRVLVANNATNEFTVTLEKCNGVQSAKIPAVICVNDEGIKYFKVVSVDDYAFSEYGGLDVTFMEWTNPETGVKKGELLSCGGAAFPGARYVKEIRFPASLKSLSGWHGIPRLLQNIVVDPACENVKVVESADPEGKKSKIVVMNNVATICLQRSFTSGESLTKLTLPEGITGIDWGAISYNVDCSKLETISLPSTFETLNYPNGISGYECLKGFEVSEDNENYFVWNPGGYTDGKGGILMSGKNSASATLVKMGRAYYRGEASEHHLALDTKIGGTLPINEVCMLGCNGVKSLTSVTIPDVMFTVGEQAFSGVNTLHDFNCYTCTTLGKGFVLGCKEVNLLMDNCGHLSGSNPHTMKWLIDESSVVYSVDKKDLLIHIPSHTFGAGAGDYEVKPECENILANAFAGCGSLTSVKLNNVKTIEDSAFGSTGITSVIIPPSVETIGLWAFSNNSLQSVTIQDGSTPLSIASYAFIGGSNSYESIDIPARVAELSAAAFDGPSFKTLNIAKNSNLKTLYSQGSKDVFEKVCFEEGPSNIKTFSTPFNTYSHLKAVENIPTSVEEFTANSFNSAGSALPDGEYLTITFQNPEESQLKRLGASCFVGSKLQAFDMPANVETIGQQCFKDCAMLDHVTLPATCNNVDVEAFLNCSMLDNIFVAEGNTTYASCGGILTDVLKQELLIFPNKKAMQGFTILPPSLKKIGQKAFYNCKAVKSVVMPKYINSIGNFAFCGCDNLTDIYFLGTDVQNVNAEVKADNEKTDPNQQDHRFASYSETDEAPAVTSAEKLATIILHYPDYEQGVSAVFQQGEFWANCPENNRRACETTNDDDENSYYIMATTNESFANDAFFIHTGSNTYTYVLPSELDGHNVSHVGDYAFEDISSDVKEVVFRNPIWYLGVNLFDPSNTNIESVFIAPESKRVSKLHSSSTQFGIGYGYFSSIQDALSLSEDDVEDLCYYPLKGQDKVNIYVPYIAKAAYEHEEFSVKYNPDITYSNQLKTRIPLPTITNSNATFSREFDVDLSNREKDKNSDRRNIGAKTVMEGDKDMNKPAVCAYVSKKEPIMGGNDMVGIVMESINNGANPVTTPLYWQGPADTEDVGIDGTYIPANTGVLIQAIAGTSPDNFSYEIGMLADTSLPSVQGNIMKSVTRDGTMILPQGSDGKYNYYLKDGKFWSPENWATIPVHRSYMSMDLNGFATSGSSDPTASKKLVFLFSQNDVDAFMATGVKNVNADTKADVIYDLSGRRVNAPQKSGVYVKNGKKVIL